MADTKRLFTVYTEEQVNSLLNQAIKLAKDNPKLNWSDIQKAFSVGFEPACIIQDWLSDEYLTEPRISKYWIRCGRIYVLNNAGPSLYGMTERLKIAWRTALAITLELQKTGLVEIKSDFSLERICPQATGDKLIKQVKALGRRYHGRCEPDLLMRKMFIDFETASRLSKYGRENLGLTRRFKERIKNHFSQNEYNE